MRFLITLIVVCQLGRYAHAAFIVEAHETGLAFDRFEFGEDTVSASPSIPSRAIGLEATNSIFGGDGISFPDTYVFYYQPGEDEDNFLPAAGTVLGSRDGSPGEGNLATGLVGGVSGLYNVYITSPSSVNVSGVPSTITITQDGDDIILENDQNNEMTGDNTAPPGNAFVGGMNNAWYLLKTVELLAGDEYSLTMEAGTNTFVSQRVHGVMWERLPVRGTPGDFNNDGDVNAADIDELTIAIADGSNDFKYDLNEDGDVDRVDRELWVREIVNTWFGDSNLDGEFNSTDFVVVFREGEYEDELSDNSTWRSGDWNGDRDFNSTDFVTAFLDSGYEKGPRPPAAVPEPNVMVLALVGFLLLPASVRR